MQKEIVKQLDGYADIVKEIKIAEKYGSDFSAQKDDVTECINITKLTTQLANITKSAIFQISSYG